MRVARKTGAHEDVQHVVHVPLGGGQRQPLVAGERARQVGMAAVMVLVAAQQELGVGIAPCADDIVHAAAIVVPAVPVERVVGDGRHRPESGQRAPQPVAGADMGGVQRARLAAEEALGQVVGVPQVQVADLRTLDADDPEEVTGRDLEGPRLARWDDHFGDPAETLPRCFVERPVVWRYLVDGIADDRRRLPPLGRVGGAAVLGR